MRLRQPRRARGRSRGARRLRRVAGGEGRGGRARFDDVRRTCRRDADGARRRRRARGRHGAHPRPPAQGPRRRAAVQSRVPCGPPARAEGLRGARRTLPRLLPAARRARAGAGREAAGGHTSDGQRRARDRRFPARREGPRRPACLCAAGLLDDGDGREVAGRRGGRRMGVGRPQKPRAPRAGAHAHGTFHGPRLAWRRRGRAAGAHARDRPRPRAGARAEDVRPPRGGRRGAGRAAGVAEGASVAEGRAPRLLVPRRARARRGTRLGCLGQVPEGQRLQRGAAEPRLGGHGLLRLVRAAGRRVGRDARRCARAVPCGLPEVRRPRRRRSRSAWSRRTACR